MLRVPPSITQKGTAMDYTALQHDIPHHTWLDYTTTTALVLVTIYGMAVLGEWFSTDSPVMAILKRNWRWLWRR